LALKELDTLRAMHALPGGVGETSLAEGEQHLVRIERLLRDAQEGATRVAGIMRELGAFTLSERDLATLDPTELLDLAIGFTAGPSLDHVRIMRRVDPAPLVRGSKWQLARVLAHGIQSVVEELDRAGIERCLLDLHVGTDARGWVEIRAHASAEAPADTGATSKRTGRPAPPSARATSVGVSVAEHILASHGGELLVCEEPGGRDFVLRLPPLDGPRARGEERGAKPGRRSRVLVIDDEPMIGRVLEISLQPECDVTFAESAREALPLLERGEGFDVILCDLTMPGMTGEQLYERLREQHPELVDRVIMMSGGATTREGSRFLASMEGRRIDKPFRVDELLPLIKARVQARAQAHAGSL
jgi:CheY-like chemotaxis protein